MTRRCEKSRWWMKKTTEKLVERVDNRVEIFACRAYRHFGKSKRWEIVFGTECQNVFRKLFVNVSMLQFFYRTVSSFPVENYSNLNCIVWSRWGRVEEIVEEELKVVNVVRQWRGLWLVMKLRLLLTERFNELLSSRPTFDLTRHFRSYTISCLNLFIEHLMSDIYHSPTKPLLLHSFSLIATNHVNCFQLDPVMHTLTTQFYCTFSASTPDSFRVIAPKCTELFSILLQSFEVTFSSHSSWERGFR